MSLSPQRRLESIDALRRGTVPRTSLDAFAVGLDRFEQALDEELRKAAGGGGVFKAVRGEYGCGKTFFVRWLADRARKRGFATSEGQVSETETPRHRLETVYRRLMERLSTADTLQGALRNIVDGWFFTLEEDVLAEGQVDADDQAALVKRTSELLEQRLAKVTATAPMFSAALRGYREALAEGDQASADGILAWLSGQP
ncbi:MAG: BREX system ATP-binding domain-containing protein, partial [Planctomyces sp.]